MVRPRTPPEIQQPTRPSTEGSPPFASALSTESVRSSSVSASTAISGWLRWTGRHPGAEGYAKSIRIVPAMPSASRRSRTSAGSGAVGTLKPRRQRFEPGTEASERPTREALNIFASADCS